MNEDKVKRAVKSKYSQVAAQSNTGCCSCGDCGTSPLLQAEAVGYQKAELEHIPQQAAIGVGCGNPTAIAELRAGETVLDLGSGAGIDVFLAANKVGPTGKVIGVDMTQEMISRANEIAGSNGYKNVEFRLGEIENLPVDGNSTDVVISNCVINLSADKPRVFQETYRVLKPGGRLTVSDIVAEQALSEEMRQNPDAWASCTSGALEQGEYLDKIREAGFTDLEITQNREFYVEDCGSKQMVKLLSITVRAYKR